MMPTIRIDDDVFEGLKSLAEPFTDTPNSVIRRLLAERAPSAKPQTRGPEGGGLQEPIRTAVNAPRRSRVEGLTSQALYEPFLLHVLATKYKGEADKNHVTRDVIALMKENGFLGPADEERVSTGETKSENSIAWVRNALKERGWISRNSPRGKWELTPDGLEQGRKVALPSNGN